MKEQLLVLIKKIEKLVKQGISNSLLKPEEESFFRWELKDFKYGKKGIESSSAEGKNFTKNSWFRASRQVSNLVKGSDEYMASLNVLKERFRGREDIEQLLERFVNYAIWKILYNKNEEEFNADHFVKRFISDLEGKPANYEVKIQFQGIVLESALIKIPEIDILLRQPIREDLEKEMPHYGPSFSNHLAYPSAIGEINFLSHRGREIQLKVEKLTALLRLFKTGSVKHLSYSMHTDSLIDIGVVGGTVTSGGHLVAIESSFIQSNDTEKLKNFIQILDPLLPSKFYMFGEGVVTPVTIAFDRYSDALLRVSIIEERIANAIMGLEALLLEATQELSYRLGLRIAKLFSSTGEDAKKNREIIRDAYRIRNLFAHGSHLSSREKRKFEEKYETLDDVLRKVLNFLRRLIIMMIVMQKSKEEFVLMLDDALIDKEAEAQLNNKVSIVKNIW